MERGAGGKEKQDAKTAWIFIGPFLFFFAAFKLYPILYGLAVSFFDRNSARKLADNTFVGLLNYAKAVQSETVRIAFAHTVVFSVIYTVFTMGIALLLALVLSKKFAGRTAVRTMFYLPYVTNIIAVGIVWKYILHPTNGPVNHFLRAAGVPKEMLPEWLSGAVSALPTTALVASWAALAFPLITFLAAIQNNPKDLYEAAEIEGVNIWQRFRFITLPLLMPTAFLLLTITIINSFKNFSVIAGLTGGGPGTATLVASYQIYNDAFSYMKFSISAAQGVLLTILVFIVNAVVTAGKKKWDA
jgi:multiple sugar transport system permease protein